MVEYRTSAHAVFDIKYHFVWIAKYRYKILRGRIAERARDLLRQIGAARGVVIMRGAVAPDHIHMLVSAPPELAPAKLVQNLKGRSSRWLQDEFPDLGKRYWGQHLWERGYFVGSVGAVDEETIKKYIESQISAALANRQDKAAIVFSISSATWPGELDPSLSRCVEKIALALCRWLDEPATSSVGNSHAAIATP